MPERHIPKPKDTLSRDGDQHTSPRPPQKKYDSHQTFDSSGCLVRAAGTPPARTPPSYLHSPSTTLSALLWDRRLRQLPPQSPAMPGLPRQTALWAPSRPSLLAGGREVHLKRLFETTMGGISWRPRCSVYLGTVPRSTLLPHAFRNAPSCIGTLNKISMIF